MEAGAGKPAVLAKRERVRRANRRLNGMGTKAGLPDPPKRGYIGRTIALLDAALRVWETKNRPITPVWQRRSR